MDFRLGQGGGCSTPAHPGVFSGSVQLEWQKLGQKPARSEFKSLRGPELSRVTLGRSLGLSQLSLLFSADPEKTSRSLDQNWNSETAALCAPSCALFCIYRWSQSNAVGLGGRGLLCHPSGSGQSGLG